MQLARLSLPALTPLLMLALAIPGGLGATGSGAEQHGKFEINYSAMPTTRLPEQVAQNYNIPQSQVQGLILVSVLDDGTPVRATVRGHARTENDESLELSFRRIDTGGRISHIAIVRIEDEKKLRFDLNVRPQMHDDVYEINFEETFYID